MTIELILTTILTSAADSLNPVAITQQFVLQGMVKKRSHIWFFIWATYITNFICGMLAYYGLLAMISNLWNKILKTTGGFIYIIELVIGVAFLIIVIKNITKQKKRVVTDENNADESEIEVKSKIKSVTPLSLFSLGVIATIMELTSALPYFAFLGVLLNYQLSLPKVFFLQALYNLIYASPLMLLYFIYCKKQMLFDSIYTYLKNKMKKLAGFIYPIFLTLLGAFLVLHATNLIIHL